MSQIIDRVKVVLTALVTYLTAAAVIVSAAAPEIVKVLPDDWRGGFSEGVVRVLAAIVAAVAIIRRVTPVDAAERGLLPPS
jgi:hypothetical protein